ncbi:MAG: tRNA uridine-5-carboxymethylaminomethyl(34) synthesis enzyme MnmG [Spirochaetia bacterium]|nr:tRNA uridine-5-carboxymethylaminomethyl(34) synthesis enzyme MnmG [Spirochaetia bacterium]
MDFDAIVIGGGHAGIEAGLALSRLGFNTLFITQNIDTIGKLSCNPAVGGLSKGNMVREIDALGGEMAHLIDHTMIQFRILNRSRGPAVQAPRAQADKFAYSALAKYTLEHQKDLHLFQDTVTDFILSSDGYSIQGVITERNMRFTARAVVLTTGTFMEGKIFIGKYWKVSGRLGEPAAEGLGVSLRRMGFDVGRLKTGTPARVKRSSLDYSKMEMQPGDDEMLQFSFFGEKVQRPKVPCWITYTNEKTHEIIRANFHQSPLFSGMIVGLGPRYCPSIEDKVKRFPDRERHQIFVEPEGLDSEEMYLNGISSSLPEEVQNQFLHTLPGLEHVEVVRPGYAVEYDYLNPIQLYPSLMTKRLKGLFIAGQTNGTSGYEEAGCQGLMAGINAAMYLQGKKPLVLSRTEAYIGVLIDDLVTMGTKEPYRMFTSRAEHRLSLRHDTADLRLLEKGYEAGLVTEEVHSQFLEKKDKIDEIKELLSQRHLGAKELAACEKEAFNESLRRHTGKTFDQIIRDPEVSLEQLLNIDPSIGEGVRKDWLQQIELDIKYDGYIARQERQNSRIEKMERMVIPEGFDYDSVESLSAESCMKFKQVLPATLGQASRISGVRTSDIAVLMIHLGKKNGSAAE